MQYCPHCLRNYQRKMYLDRHVAVCQIVHMNKKTRMLEGEEKTDTPTVRELYVVVMELVAKNNQLEEKIREMTKWVNVKKQKINIIEWLNTTQIATSCDYQQWLKKIKIKREHLELLFRTDYVGGVVNVLKQLLPLDGETHAMRAFKSKENIFYIFNENQWVIADADMYIKLMYLLDKLFMTEFIKWQEENKEKINLDHFSPIYAQNTKKIMAIREQAYSRIKKELYNYLQAELPQMIEYEVMLI